MSADRFQKLSKYLSILFKTIAFLILGIMIFGSFTFFIQQKTRAFNLDTTKALSIVYSDATITQKDYDWAVSIVLPITLAFLGYIFFKASYLFDYLAEGKTPFTYKFIRSVKIMGFILVSYDLVASLLYMFLINFTADDGKFFYLSVSTYFFVGLILCLVSGILSYGVNLQKLEVEKEKLTDE